MTRDEIIKELSKNKSYIQQNFEVSKIGLFGSYAKNKQTEDSDIDIYVEFKHKTFDNLAGLWNYLEDLYQKKVDLFHKHKNNNKVIVSNIQKDVIYG
jgi:predicted nucleotidyltransferase